MNSAVFPGLQGGPLMHVIAAKAVASARREAELQDLRRKRCRQCQGAGREPEGTGLDIVSGGTDNHLMLVDLRPKNATGKRARLPLAAPTSPATRTAFPSTRKAVRHVRCPPRHAGRHHARLRQAEFREIGKLISEVLDGLKVANSDEGNASVEAAVKAKVLALTDRFPLYPYLG